MYLALKCDREIFSYSYFFLYLLRSISEEFNCQTYIVSISSAANPGKEETAKYAWSFRVLKTWWNMFENPPEKMAI